VDKIKPSPFQPRLNFDSAGLAELAQSIKERGVIQPIVVRNAGGNYELVVGERRLRAMQALGRDTIPAVIIESLSNEESMELTLIENIQREDLNPMEEAHAYHRLMTECNLTQNDVAAKVGKDRSSIANSIRLLTLPGEIQQMIVDGKLSAGHARTLLAIGTDSEKIALAEKAVAGEMSVRDLEKLIYSDKTHRRARRAKLQSSQIASIEDELRRKLGTKVTINQRRKGGRITIEYYSNDDMERILAIMGFMGNQ
jgi:ParB family chromosome partitioning protein